MRRLDHGGLIARRGRLRRIWSTRPVSTCAPPPVSARRPAAAARRPGAGGRQHDRRRPAAGGRPEPLGLRRRHRQAEAVPAERRDLVGGHREVGRAEPRRRAVAAQWLERRRRVPADQQQALAGAELPGQPGEQRTASGSAFWISSTTIDRAAARRAPPASRPARRPARRRPPGPSARRGRTGPTLAAAERSRCGSSAADTPPDSSAVITRPPRGGRGLGGQGRLAVAGAADDHADARARHPIGQPGPSEVISGEPAEPRRPRAARSPGPAPAHDQGS